MEIAKRLVAIRKNRKISQKYLYVLSDVPYATKRKFENTEDISFASFIKIAMILRLHEDLDRLFEVRKEYTSIEEVLRDQ